MKELDIHTVLCSTEKDTQTLGEALGEALAPGDIVGLSGPLGAGKTRLSRAIGAGAGVVQGTVVNSPTFTILNVYDTADCPIFHLDLYRLTGTDDLESVGLPDMLEGHGILLVEWFDTFPDAFPADHLHIRIEISGEGKRQFTLTAHGDASSDLLEEFRSVWSADAP